MIEIQNKNIGKDYLKKKPKYLHHKKQNKLRTLRLKNIINNNEKMVFTCKRKNKNDQNGRRNDQYDT